MAAGAGAPDGGPEGPNRGGGGAFACNLCLEPARDAVIGRCGHLYCWPCLHQWLLTRPRCVVCGAGMSRDDVVPLYGRDSAHRDPRLETPPRPRGQRPEPESQGVPPPAPGSTWPSASERFPSASSAPPPSPPPAGTGDAGDPPPGSLDSVFLFIAAAFFLWLLSV
ncbi:E3 ubiquitin-protein ligase RNF5 isoform X1 [Grus americana]|uniref:E3 ubiquitin-protein ligase RNF5 isoform X1 n=1 Tax=Grus americana TaxID=9117 RepID=UPI0024082E7D|nr:E3 ubiquitin-protein ligase RNF5 isoform X1 [Grus americana]